MTLEYFQPKHWVLSRVKSSRRLAAAWKITSHCSRMNPELEGI